MTFRPTGVAAAAMLLSGGTVAVAQQVPALPPPVIASPTYVVVAAEVVINRPAAAVWARIGKFCDIGEWGQYSCRILSGKDGELGTMRFVDNSVTEMLAGRTDLSYTYVMPVRTGIPYNAMHGTVEARPITARTTKVIYSQVYDNSTLADDAARAADILARHGRVTRFVQNMKIVVEGGTLIPRPLP